MENQDSVSWAIWNKYWPKKTKDEKAEETPECSETAETTENVQEESVDYNKFYSKFIQRALDTIGNKFAIIQNRINNHGVFSQIEKIRSITGYIDMLQKCWAWCSKLKSRTRRKRKMTKQTQ